MRHLLLLLVIVALQGPTPTPSKVGKPPHQESPATDHSSGSDQRGTDQSPMVVKISPTPKTQEETEQDTQDRREKAATDWWNIRLTGALALIALLQLGVYGYQSFKLNETVKSAGEQSAAMERHIGEATRSANAMETIATNIQAGNHAVLRAYITVVVGSGVYQERNKPGQPDLKFMASSTVTNSGFTQARNVHIVKRAAILSVPPPDEFDFPLPQEDPEELPATVGAHQSYVLNVTVDDFVPDSEVYAIKKGAEQCLYVWGQIVYDDIFGMKHCTRFGHTVFWLPTGRIFGNYIPGQNDAD